MSTSDIIFLIALILIILVFYTYGIYTRSYLSGFKEGLKMGKKIGKIDAQSEEQIPWDKCSNRKVRKKMNKEEALNIWLPVIKQGVETMPECKEALDMAIEALKREYRAEKERLVLTIDRPLDSENYGQRR